MSEPRPAIERLRRRKERHQQRNKVYRFMFATVGVLVILIGIALIPLPGPGWLVVAVGVGMLALEFDRMERLLERILERLEKTTENLSHRQKILLVVLGVAGVVSGPQRRSSGTSPTCRSRRVWRNAARCQGGEQRGLAAQPYFAEPSDLRTAADRLAERAPLELDAAAGAARGQDLRGDEQAAHQRHDEERLEHEHGPIHGVHYRHAAEQV